MATSRTIYKYHFKLGNKIVHTGITRDIDRREAEHRRKPGWGRGHIVQDWWAHHPRSCATMGSGTATTRQADRAVIPEDMDKDNPITPGEILLEGIP